MISGMRKAPPISISSPRETMTSLPWARVFKPSSTAAALLLTTVAASAPVRSTSSCSKRLFALAALAGGEIVFQIDRITGHGDHGIDGRLRQQRAAQVRVQNRAGGVDDTDMAGAALQCDLRLDLIEDGVIIAELAFALADICAQLIQGVAAFLRDIVAVIAGEKRLAARMIEQAIDGR